MKNNLKSGNFGERIATEHLQKIGYKILQRNFKARYGEIDIIAIDPSAGSGQEVLVFVEVKTRTSNQFGTPLEAISYFKLKSLIKTAQFYKQSHRGLPDSLRIDAISVMLVQNADPQIELIKNISGF